MNGNAAPLILHVFPTFAVGGAQARFAALANHFGASFRHLIVSLDGNMACRARLGPTLDVRFPLVPARKNAMFTNAWRFHRLLRAWRPDVMVTCNWGAIEFALANALPVTRHIHVVDGFGPEEQSGQISRRVWMRRLALAGGTVVLPSRTLTTIALNEWHLRPQHVRYVPNGVDLERFAAAAATPRTHGAITIGTIAALRTEKNIARLLRAFGRLNAPIARLVIVGDGAERQPLEALAASLGIADRVAFVGHQEDTPFFYAGFDIFALSSDTEQMPLSLLEAMASGLPVAATDVGDVRTMVSADNTPYVTHLTDDALASALQGLVDDPASRSRIGAANLVKARHDFDQAAMFRAWSDLWTGAVPRA